MCGVSRAGWKEGGRVEGKEVRIVLFFRHNARKAPHTLERHPQGAPDGGDYGERHATIS